MFYFGKLSWMEKNVFKCLEEGLMFIVIDNDYPRRMIKI